VTLRDSFKVDFSEFCVREVRIPFPQTCQKELARHLRQLKCLEQPLLGRHATKDFEVLPVVRARFGIHAGIVACFGDCDTLLFGNPFHGSIIDNHDSLKAFKDRPRSFFIIVFDRDQSNSLGLMPQKFHVVVHVCEG